MLSTHENDKLKALNDAIQAERDPKRVSALVDQILAVFDGKEKKTPAPDR